MDYIARYLSPLGPMTLAADGESLTGLWFDGQSHYGSTLSPICREEPSLAVFGSVRLWLDSYFAGDKPSFTPPFALRGSAFRRIVWRELLTIGYGHTATYGIIAQRIDCPSPRAIASAIAHNPIMLIVPCHRVVGSDGSLKGYSGGVARKAQLLRLERPA